MTSVANAGDGSALEVLRRDYLAALLRPDGRGAWRAVQEAVAAGVSARAVYLEVIGPAMTEIGTLWETARISVAQEHLATQITQSVIARLAPELEAGAAALGRSAVVASTPGELHDLGQRMVGDFLEAAGWEVLVLGGDVPPHAITELVAGHGAALVGLSTALPANLLAAGAACSALRRLDPAPFIVAGGRAYGDEETRALAVGADAYAADPEQLLAVLDARFGPA